MRSSLLLPAFALLTVAFCPLGLPQEQQGAKPLTPEEAFKKVGENVTLLMEVKSTGGNTARYLNSEANYRSPNNFTIYLPQALLAKLKLPATEDAGKYYQGKTIEVTGTVALYRGSPQIRVNDPSQIKVIEPAAEATSKRTGLRTVKGKGKGKSK